MKTMRRSALTLALILAISACTLGGEPDPYDDLDAAPPPPVEDPTINTSGSIAPSSKGDDLMDINVAGFEAPTTSGLTAAEMAELPDSAFTVVEAGTVKGITVERIGGDVRASADVVFLFDSTGSMGAGLASVQDSIMAFTDFLDDSGLDVKVGAVTFGDAFDTVQDTTSPDRGTSLRATETPDFDVDARPTFPLTEDVGAFQTFVAEDAPRGGGDGPENALGALEFGFEDLAWRAGAQRLLIVITDICAHTVDSFESAFGSYDGYAKWLPPTTVDLIDQLSGQSTVHVVGPSSVSCGQNMNVFAGADGTGGVFFPWDTSSAFDLTELPIAEATAGGYVITYRGTRDGTEKPVRVVIDDGAETRGEFTIRATY